MQLGYMKSTAAEAIAEDPVETLRRRVAYLEIFYDLTNLLNRTSDLQVIFEKTIESLQRAVDAPRASILLADAEGRMRFQASVGLSDAYQRAAEGHSPWKPHDPNPTAVLVRDVQRHVDGPPVLAAMVNEGIRALAFIPLISRGRLLGTFMLYYDTPHDFPAADVRVVQSLADHVAFAIERKQREDQIQTLNDALIQRIREYEEVVRDLEHSRVDLQEKVRDLEQFEDVVVGRELKMIQLERELDRLKARQTLR
jgi:GAF domain-containing protein